jgi:hypothetical protein
VSVIADRHRPQQHRYVAGRPVGMVERFPVDLSDPASTAEAWASSRSVRRRAGTQRLAPPWRLKNPSTFAPTSPPYVTGQASKLGSTDRPLQRQHPKGAKRCLIDPFALG